MPILRPAEYQHNNPNDAFVDSNFVRGGGRVVADLTALYALTAQQNQLKERVTRVWVTANSAYYILVDKNNIGNSTGWVVDSGGTSGVSSISINAPLTTSSSTGAVTLSTSVTANKLIGRYTASTGPMQEISIGTGLSLDPATGILTSSGGSGGTTTNALTINNTGSGSISGTTFNGSSAVTISYNSIGASPLAGSGSLTTLGTVTSGKLDTGAVLGGVTMTLGSDAAGDIYYRSSAGVLTRLAIGSTGQVLKVSATSLPSWAAEVNQSITLSGDLSGSGATSISATIASGAVGLSKMANLAANSIIGNHTNSSTTPLALSVAQVTAMLSPFSITTTAQGLVPGSNGVGATYYLNGNGGWSVPPGGTSSVSITVNSPLSSTPNPIVGTATLSLASNYGDTQNPYASKTAKYVLAAPNNANGVPDFRLLDASDITAGIFSSAVGGTGNGFTKFTGPATTEKTFTLPNSNGTILVAGASQAAIVNADISTSAGIVLSKLETILSQRILGNNTGGSASPTALTGTQVTAMLDTFSSVKGLVPSSPGGITKFLRADGSWEVPASSGGITRIIDSTASTSFTAGSAANTDYVYLINATLTVTLPSAAGNTNQYTIKHIGSTSNVVSIATTTSATIDGSNAPITITVPYVSITLVSNGTNWFII